MTQPDKDNYDSSKSDIFSQKYELGASLLFEGLLGKSSVMEKVVALIERVIHTDLPVLLIGETGTGKSLLARAIHLSGSRRGKPFVVQNCGALPLTLLESELFGYRKGAFTGAVSDQHGLFEAAHGGTIFLDEIGEAPMDVQIRLLHVLENGEIRRVGETIPRKVDIRVIAATNRDLAGDMQIGHFRQDLYYRLNVFPIHLPPLRERREDIPVLVDAFLRVAAEQSGKRVMGVTDEVMEALYAYHWPGNVRELENEVKRVVALVQEGEAISLDLLSEQGRRTTVGETMRVVEEAIATGETLKEAEHLLRRRMIERALQECGTFSPAAKRLGLSRQSLRAMMKRLGMG